MQIEICNNLIDMALSKNGASGLSGSNVLQLLNYIENKSIMLARVEAKRIEPEWDLDMPEYSLYGINLIEGDFSKTKRFMAKRFKELNNKAQEKERYAIRYDIWMSK